MIARSSCCTRYSDIIIIIIIRSVRHQLSSLFRLIIVVAMLYWQQQTSEDRTHTVYTTMYVHGVTHIITTRKYTSRTFHYYCRNYIIIATACNIFFYFSVHTRSDISTLPDDEPRARRRRAWELGYARGPVHARRLSYYIMFGDVQCYIMYLLPIV